MVVIESASGFREGGRTGITALVISFCFFVSLFFTPLIASVPPYATGPALILVGSMMLKNLIDIDWGNVREAVPAFLTVAIMPLTYSIAYGVIAGVCSYMFLYLSLFAVDLVAVLFRRKKLREVLYDNCPDILQDRFKSPPPFRIPSAELQSGHLDPAHAAHHAAVADSFTDTKPDVPRRYGPADDVKLPESSLDTRADSLTTPRRRAKGANLELNTLAGSKHDV